MQKYLDLFQTIEGSLLVKIATGEINAKALAKLELANRGYNASGEYVGFLKMQPKLNKGA